MKKNILRRTASIILTTMLCFITFAGNGITAKAVTYEHEDILEGNFYEASDSFLLGQYTLQEYDEVCFVYYGSYDTSTKTGTDLISKSNIPSGSSITEDNTVPLDNTLPRWKLATIDFVYGEYLHFIFVAEKWPLTATTLSAGCAHTCEWITESEASETADGMMAYQCTKCGAITDYMAGGTGSTSAYAVFNKNVALKVNQAESGATLHIDTQLWTSFSKNVMAAIAARRDITVELNYRLEGKNYQIVIPAGASVPNDVDFAGFNGYLAGLYGHVAK